MLEASWDRPSSSDTLTGTTAGGQLMPRVSGLGHLGIFVRDIERMTAFYRDFLGMQVTKQDPEGRMMFLSCDPESVDHEIALMTGRAEDDGPPLIQQISLRVPSLNDLRTFHRNLKDQGFKIDQVVTHLSALGCYFFDPEGNRTEVFWLTGLPSWVMIGIPIAISNGLTPRSWPISSVSGSRRGTCAWVKNPTRLPSRR